MATKTEPAEHIPVMHSVLVSRCSCGWQSQVVTTVDEGARAYAEHLTDALPKGTPPTVPDE